MTISQQWRFEPYRPENAPRRPAVRGRVGDADAAYARRLRAHGQPDRLAVVQPEPWMVDAACASTNPNLFYPEKGDPATGQAARTVCAGCPVRDECLTYAIDHREVFGIWGGKSVKERRRLERERRRSAA